MRSSKNFLIVKGDIGKAKPFTMDLPDKNHTYGMPNRFDKPGVGERKCPVRGGALCGWLSV